MIILQFHLQPQSNMNFIYIFHIVNDATHVRHEAVAYFHVVLDRDGVGVEIGKCIYIYIFVIYLDFHYIYLLYT